MFGQACLKYFDYPKLPLLALLSIRHFHETGHGEKKIRQRITQKPAIKNAFIPHNKAFEAAYQGL